MCFGASDLEPLSSEVCRVPAQRRGGSGSYPALSSSKGQEAWGWGVGVEAGPREQFPGISQHFTEVLLGKAAAVNNDDCGRWRAGVSAPMRAEREAETSEKDAAERARRLAALKHGLHFRGWKMRHQEGCGEGRSGWLGGRQP